MPIAQQVTQSDFPILRVSTPTGTRLRWLDHGKAGNLQTAAEMALLVREAAMRDEGLCSFAAGLLLRAGLDSHSDTDSILDAVFRFAQSVKYIHDPGGNFDAISSARETLNKKPMPYGDCDDLSVLLASLLACLGFTPSFVLAKYHDESSGFDHIYVEVEDKGNRIPLDPTSRAHGIGWESPRAIDRVVFPIFGSHGAFNSLAGAMSSLVTPQTISLGTSLLNTFNSLFAGNSAKKASTSAQENARWQGHEQVMQAMDAIQAAIDNCQITAAQGADLARQAVTKFYSVCDASFNKDIAKSCRNYGSEQGGFDYRVQQISNRMNPGCAVISAPVSNNTTAAAIAAITDAGAAGSNASGGLGGLSVSLPTALLILGGGILALRALKG